MDNYDKKTSANKIINGNLNFNETFDFPIYDKESVLTLKLFSSSNPNKSLGEIYILDLENEEISPDFEIKAIK